MKHFVFCKFANFLLKKFFSSIYIMLNITKKISDKEKYISMPWGLIKLFKILKQWMYNVFIKIYAISMVSAIIIINKATFYLYTSKHTHLYNNHIMQTICYPTTARRCTLMLVVTQMFSNYRENKQKIIRKLIKLDNY